MIILHRLEGLDPCTDRAAANRQQDFSRCDQMQLVACESLIWDMAAGMQNAGAHAEAGRLCQLARRPSPPLCCS